MLTKPFGFEFEGRRYAGLLDLPGGDTAKGLVLLVHGSGRTDVASGSAYKTLRTRLTGLGFAVYAYDKAGNGNSEGEYNSEQPVQNSAEEALAAVSELRRQDVAGADYLGLWGISRAGWIVPLMLSQDPSLAFWISVSGPGPLSNMEYLLASNWQLRGYAPAQIATLLTEWKRGFEIQRSGGSYADYVAATPSLLEDPLVLKLRGEYTKARFQSYQQFLKDNPPIIDKATGLMVFVQDLEARLQAVRIPVLAIFGEKDTQVDWRASAALYKETMGVNAALTVHTLKDCNHFMLICEDCGYGDQLEKVRRTDTGEVCPGFYSSISAFLSALDPTGR
ncbi:MAG: alpha/beta fold hydrolase [Pseudomonadota bacterium]